LNLRALLAYCQSAQEEMLRCLEEAVKIESPTNSKAGIDRLAGYFARECRRAGGKASLLPHPTAGSSLVAEFWGKKRDVKPVLLLGHLDTVWDIGTLKSMPFRIRHGRAYGPGIFDMKSGIVGALWAIRALRACGIQPAGPVRMFLNSDEEAASMACREQLMAEALKARAVLVLEPAAEGGALKTSRKGVGEFRVTAYGRSAHAGIDPEAGVNAISELARQLLRIETFARPGRGLTLSAGVIEGGTRPNVVPERASARIDVRILRLRDRATIERRMRGLQPILRGARLVIEGGINRPPLERTMAVALFRRAKALARGLDIDLREAASGGGSDGNFTAALGIPTLDGLGAVGAGAHAAHEHVVIRELPRRAALLAALLANL